MMRRIPANVTANDVARTTLWAVIVTAVGGAVLRFDSGIPERAEGIWFIAALQVAPLLAGMLSAVMIRPSDPLSQASGFVLFTSLVAAIVGAVILSVNGANANDLLTALTLFAITVIFVWSGAICGRCIMLWAHRTDALRRYDVRARDAVAILVWITVVTGACVAIWPEFADRAQGNWPFIQRAVPTITAISGLLAGLLVRSRRPWSEGLIIGLIASSIPVAMTLVAFAGACSVDIRCDAEHGGAIVALLSLIYMVPSSMIGFLVGRRVARSVVRSCPLPTSRA